MTATLLRPSMNFFFSVIFKRSASSSDRGALRPNFFSLEIPTLFSNLYLIEFGTLTHLPERPVISATFSVPPRRSMISSRGVGGSERIVTSPRSCFLNARSSGFGCGGGWLFIFSFMETKCICIVLSISLLNPPSGIGGILMGSRGCGATGKWFLMKVVMIACDVERSESRCISSTATVFLPSDVNFLSNSSKVNCVLDSPVDCKPITTEFPSLS
mmetsp:Transcript_31464/g.46403  ORF Transcript_31464/g.46403 Transcript_31464/m.46403 type:complete len:215 (-) Transcript_31464:1578-2222(-)